MTARAIACLVAAVVGCTAPDGSRIPDRKTPPVPDSTPPAATDSPPADSTGDTAGDTIPVDSTDTAVTPAETADNAPDTSDTSDTSSDTADPSDTAETSDTGWPRDSWDVVISDPNDSLPDPEFDPHSMRITWSHLHGEFLYVADLDPFTGAIDPVDGRGELVDIDVARIGAFKNGPEWFLHDGQSDILYTKEVNGSYRVFHAWETPNGWENTRLFRGGGARGSLDPATTDPHLTVSVNDTTIWIRLDKQDGGLLMDFQQRYQTWWIRDLPLVLWSGPVGDGTAQMQLTDVALGQTTQLTHGPDASHVDGAIWRSPVIGEDMLFAVLLNLQEEPVALLIYQQIQGQWTEVKQITAPPGPYRYFISPEVFVTGGRSWIAYLLSDSPTNSDNGTAEVWVAGAEVGHDMNVRVSNDEVMVRKDPETLVSPWGTWVYYSEVTADNRRILHRCAPDFW